MYIKVAHFLNKQKVHSIVLKFLNFFGIMGLMVIKSILIGACLDIPNVYTFRFFFEIWGKNYVIKDLWKYGSNLTIQKSLIKNLTMILK
jgi:hypothetical protein